MDNIAPTFPVYDRGAAASLAKGRWCILEDNYSEMWVKGNNNIIQH